MSARKHWHRLHNYLFVTCSAAQRVAIVIWALSNKCLRNVNQSTTAPFAKRHLKMSTRLTYQSLKVWQVMRQELTSWRGEVTLSSFNEEVLFTSDRHSDVTEAMHFILGRHRRRWVLSSFHAFAHPSVSPFVRPNDVTILILEMFQLSAWIWWDRAPCHDADQMAIILSQFWNLNFEIFHDRLGPGLRDDIMALTL